MSFLDRYGILKFWKGKQVKLKIRGLPALWAWFFVIFFVHSISAQSETSWGENPTLGVTGFLDVFYVYDFNRPEGDFRQEFLFNHNRHNEFNLNLGLLGLWLDHDRYRGRFTLQAGTYANDNYAAEPGVLKNIFEAWAGVALNRKGTLWVDAGVLPSHIGFENAISIENWTLTRSLSAENSPYFLTGARITCSPANQWHFAALVVNGWQRIQRLEGNSLLSYGTQVFYQAREGLAFNWSTFIGTDDPDETRRMRYFNNLFVEMRLTPGLGLLAGFDLGLQQASRGSSTYEIWYTPTLIGQYRISDRWKTALRLEYYHDPEGVIVPVDASYEFRTAGVSWNLDYRPVPLVACRLEARWLGGADPVFRAQDGPEQSDFFIGVSLAVKFDRALPLGSEP